MCEFAFIRETLVIIYMGMYAPDKKQHGPFDKIPRWFYGVPKGGADPEYHSMPMLRRLASLTTRTASCFLKGEAPLECPARIFREAFPKDAMQVPLGGVQDVRARHGVDIDDVLLHAQMMVSIKKGG